jgi:hypothetical protein
MNSDTKIAATKCFLGTWFVSGIYVETPCIKEMSMIYMIIIGKLIIRIGK